MLLNNVTDITNKLWQVKDLLFIPFLFPHYGPFSKIKKLISCMPIVDCVYCIAHSLKSSYFHK